MSLQSNVSKTCLLPSVRPSSLVLFTVGFGWKPAQPRKSQGTERPNKFEQLLQPGKEASAPLNDARRPRATYRRSPTAWSRTPALYCRSAPSRRERATRRLRSPNPQPTAARQRRSARPWAPHPTLSPSHGAAAARGSPPSFETSPPRSRPIVACPALPRGLPPPPRHHPRRPSSPSMTAMPPQTSPRTPPPPTFSPSRRLPPPAPLPAARRHGTCPGARWRSRHQDPPWLGSSSRPGKRCSLCRPLRALAPHLLPRQRRRSHRCPPRRHLGRSRWRTQGRSNGRSGSLYLGEKIMFMLCFVLDYCL
jgi:hypothetical protein